MKTLLCSLFALSTCVTLFAQRVPAGAALPAPSIMRLHSSVTSKHVPFASAKSTSVITTDTMYLQNNYDSLLVDSSQLYGYGTLAPADSGYLFGTNAYGDNAFAEYFTDGFMADTSIEIIGVLSNWGGTVSPTSTNTITYKLWNVDTTIYPLSAHNYLTGLPGTVFAASQQVALSSLTLNDPGAPSVTFFSNPIPNIQSGFFLGYNINYNPAALNGDTIGLRCTPDGTGFGPGYYQTDGQGDTLYFSQNAVYTSGGQWLDGYIDLYRNVNLSLMPIFFIDPTTSVKGLNRNNLTVFGCYPNPAVNSTNIRYSLQQPADVTIQVVDASGRMMTTIQQPSQATGTHIATLATDKWPAGNYIYIARTSTGAIIASQLTVTR